MLSDKSHVPGFYRRLPEWAVPFCASLFLHLLAVGCLVAWLQRPREIIWVNLLETSLVPAKSQQTTMLPPTTLADRPKPPAPVLPKVPTHAQTNASSPRLPELPARIAPATISPDAESAAKDVVAAEAATAGGMPEADVAEQHHHVPEQGVAATEAIEHRYVREQFAYIRERVMERLIYPPLARRQGWQGVVKVGFTVRADGTIEGLQIVTSSGRSLLDQQALQAVQAAAPFPAPPAPAKIVLPVLFAIEAGHR
jgi:protein TonB